MDELAVQLSCLLGYKRLLLAKDERITALQTENAMLHIKLAECHGNTTRLKKANSTLRRLLVDSNQLRESLAYRLQEMDVTIRILREQLNILRNSVASYPLELALTCEEMQSAITSLTDRSNKAAISKQVSVAVDRQLVGMQRQLGEVSERYEVEKSRRKSLHNTLVELRGNIRVHCRVRPVLPFDVVSNKVDEDPSSDGAVVNVMDEETVSFHTPKQGMRCEIPVKMFEYDRVYRPGEGQSTVFSDVKPLLTSLLDGYNVCVMAYGQTGSGKTYTMLGKEDELEPLYDDFAEHAEFEHKEGVVPQSTRELFRLLEARNHEYQSYTVEVSVIEIYNNQIRDLLDKDMKTHSVVSGRDGEMELPNVKSKPVHSVSEVMRHVLYGMKRRVEDATLVHEHSSRSHLIITLTITASLRQVSAVPLTALNRSVVLPDLQLTPPSSPSRGGTHLKRSVRHVSSTSSPSLSCTSSFSDFSAVSNGAVGTPGGEGSVFRTKLQLVDLAGSECVGMSGVTGMGLRESSHINRSLSALADVLTALSEHRGHVPYRNSRLTYLLQDSIGGDAKLLMLLCVSPSQRYMVESQQTLGFGSRARQVQRGPVRRRRTLSLQGPPFSPSSPGRQTLLKNKFQPV